MLSKCPVDCHSQVSFVSKFKKPCGNLWNFFAQCVYSPQPWNINLPRDGLKREWVKYIRTLIRTQNRHQKPQTLMYVYAWRILHTRTNQQTLFLAGTLAWGKVYCVRMILSECEQGKARKKENKYFSDQGFVNVCVCLGSNIVSEFITTRVC